VTAWWFSGVSDRNIHILIIGYLRKPTRYNLAMEENDTQRSAEQLIKQHGDKAVVVAADKFVERQRAGDGEGVAVWVHIMLAIRDLNKQEPLGNQSPSPQM